VAPGRRSRPVRGRPAAGGRRAKAPACGADEWARPRAAAALKPFAGTQTLALQDARALFFDALEPALVAAGAPRLVRATVAGTGATAFGVLVKWTVEAGGATAIVWLANVTPRPVNVALVWMAALGGGFVANAMSVTTGLRIVLGEGGTTIESEGDGALLRVTLPALAGRHSD
jgi:hypothetical protein